MKINSYKLRVLQNKASLRFTGELWVNDKLENRTTPLLDEKVTEMRLNKRIESFNQMNGTKIPNYVKGAKTNEFRIAIVEPEAEECHEEIAQTEEKEPTITAPPQTKEAQKKERRKPFTPYGLNGYLVDKQGNIRLHLDRRASAQTIVLTPEMFAMLSNMVQATQDAQKA